MAMTKLFLIALLASSAIALANDLEVQNWAQIDQQKAISAEHGTAWMPQAQASTKTMLIFHGLHESPHMMRNWADFFSQRGYNVLNVRLDGHFQPANEQGLKKVQSENWIKTANDAYALVSENSTQVDILGFSTGGTLAAHLALKHPEKVKNIFLISPAFALTEQIFFSNIFMSPMGVSSKDICRDQNTGLCRTIMSMDPDFKTMVQNGLEVSPQAGYEVQDLIQQVFEVKMVTDETYANIYMQTLEKLDTIQARVIMVNTESDAVINAQMNMNWIKNFKGKKLSLAFKKEDRISHIVMNKNEETRFQKAKMGYNKKINEIEALFDKALATEE